MKCSGSDVPFVLRVIVQSLLSGTPASLSTMAQELSGLVSSSVPELAAETHDFNLGLQEHCPACGAAVSLEDITSAVCPNGHTWGMSTFLMPWTFHA